MHMKCGHEVPGGNLATKPAGPPLLLWKELDREAAKTGRNALIFVVIVCRTRREGCQA